jgi:hypothetical protein
LLQSIDLNLPELIIDFLHEKSNYSILVLTSRSLSLLGLLKLLEKTATRLEFAHFVRAERVGKTFLANITWGGGFLIEVGHFKITALVGAEYWPHWASMLKVVD